MAAQELDLPMDAIREVCRRFDVTRLELFGSAVGENFRDDSDVDFLVEFRNNDCGPWMSKLMELEEGLAALLDRDVDVVSRRGIEQSANHIRRDHILSSARVVYRN